MLYQTFAVGFLLGIGAIQNSSEELESVFPQSLSAQQDDLKAKEEFYILSNSDDDLENAHSA